MSGQGVDWSVFDDEEGEKFTVKMEHPFEVIHCGQCGCPFALRVGDLDAARADVEQFKQMLRATETVLDEKRAELLEAQTLLGNALAARDKARAVAEYLFTEFLSRARQFEAAERIEQKFGLMVTPRLSLED